ncbi:mannonate dehydratase [Pollutibacter soli]|uniref:mannonate dehydratase n=1 Tax=Pollutibacter soli TaxID=3034157 RepID=UPI00301351B6
MTNSNEYPMIQSMRWYGPDDPVQLPDIRQAGATSVVTALDHVPLGGVWTKDDIIERKKKITDAGLDWDVVESIPVHEDIKTRNGNYYEYIENYKTSIRNLAACGIKTITYNFMPVLNWSRTDLEFKVEDGSKALRFDRTAFTCFDIFILKRKNAKNEYTSETIKKAEQYLNEHSAEELQKLQNNIIAGLPGYQQAFTLEQFKSTIEAYDGITPEQLRENLILFLQEIIPVAESVGARMAVHPDDPPFPLLGLPRIVSTAVDLELLMNAVPSKANGICFCTGSYGVRADNNLPEMIRQFADRIYFFHLRNTKRNEAGDFFEDNHLDGNTDMFSVMKELIVLSDSRKERIVMRPDHGHQMLDDLSKKTNPGYSAIGRLRGLAELRGLELGIRRMMYS